MTDYSKMTREQIAADVEADAHNWEWSVDEDGNDVPPKYGADEKCAEESKMSGSLMRLLGKR